MDQLNIWIPGVLVIGGAVLSLLDKITSNTILKRISAQGGFILVVIGALLSVKSNYDTSISKTKSDSTAIANQKKYDSVNTALGKKQEDMIHLQNRTIDSAHTIINLNQKLDSSQRKLIETQGEFLNYTTGGNSYCKMFVGDTNVTNDLAYVYFQVVGKYPVSRIQARIVDLNTIDPYNPSQEDLYKFVVDINILDPGPVYWDKACNCTRQKQRSKLEYLYSFKQCLYNSKNQRKIY